MKNVCPGKRVARAAILTEVDENGAEYQRGMKAITIPAHDQPGCRDVLVRCIKFVVPGDLDVSGGDPNAMSCYLRVKAGNSKSGHGVYTRRTPFVHFCFKSVEGAMKVLQKQVEFVKAVELGYVETIGSPEYACYLNDYMAILQGMLT